MFGMEPKEPKEAPRMFCPRCGSTMRRGTFGPVSGMFA